MSSRAGALFSDIARCSADWRFHGRYPRAGITYYRGPDEKERKWEGVERTTRKEESDGIDLIGKAGHLAEIIIFTSIRAKT